MIIRDDFFLISQRKNIARSNSDLGAVTELGSKGDETISKISVFLFFTITVRVTDIGPTSRPNISI